MIFAGVLVVTLLLMVASFPTGIFTVFSGSLSSNYSASSPAGSLAWDVIFTVLRIPLSMSLGTLFLIVSFGYLLCLVLAAVQGIGFLGALRSSREAGFGAFLENPLAGTLVVLGATSLATIVLDTLQTSAGVQTGSLSGDPFQLLMDFTVAPLLEESTFRMMMIGLPVVAVVLIARGSIATALRCLWRPSAAWDGGRRSVVKPVAYFFLAVSSLLFGYAHFAAGSGWSVGKISEAALGGLALGFLYVRYGFHTSLLLHWSIDYVGSIYSFFAQVVWGVPWTSSSGNILDVFPSVEIIFILGVPSVLLILNEVLKRFAARPSPQEGLFSDPSS